MKVRRWMGFPILALAFLFLFGCAAVPVRDAVKVDMTLPVGKIEGKEFTGIRYPFKVAAPPGWEISTQYPKFMIDLGYEKEGLGESEVFLYNPATQSNVQIDFTPASRYAKFDQPTMESLVNSITDEFKEELQQEHGKALHPKIGPTQRVSLKGVPYAARKSSTYAVKGTQREQGWIYAFAEPYQIFILYMIIEKEGFDDKGAIERILDSFEVLPRRSP